MTQHRFPCFARDDSVSLAARDVLSVLVAPENQGRWLSIHDLGVYVTDNPDETRPLLNELARSGYVNIADSSGEDGWQASSRAYRTAPIY